jgi:hypothetical protein
MAINKVLLDYKDADFPYIFDYEALGTATAPAWWDQYVGNETDKPVGYELYKKFEKPTTVKTESAAKPPTTWQPTVYGKGQYGVISHPKPKIISPNQPIMLHESRAFNQRNAAERGLRWHKDGSLDLNQLGLKVSDVSDEEMAMLAMIGMAGKQNDDAEKKYYDDVPDAIADAFFDDTMNVMTEADEEWAMLNREEAKSITSWREIMLRKLYNTMMVCRDLGLAVSIKIDNEADSDTDLLPGGPIMSEDHIHKGAN